MYSTLIDDEEYDPLLLLYLTTTGSTLQNHTRANLIAQALRRVVVTMYSSKNRPAFDVVDHIRLFSA